MKKPPHDGRRSGAPLPAPAMTPDRWQAVDAIIQSALEYDRDRRAAFVAGACREDLALQREVVSLLAAHDAAPIDFLERPAFEELGAPGGAAAAPPPHDIAPSPPSPSEGPPRGRMVSAQTMVYVTAAVLAVGTLGGWALSHWSFVAPWNRTAPAEERTGAIVTAQPTSGATDGLSLTVVDRSGQVLRTIAADRPWTPRFSADGREVAYGAFADGRRTSDIWITRVADGSTRRLTNDDGDSNDPQWSPDGSALAYSVAADGGKDVVEGPTGEGTSHVLAARPGTQFPSDWRRDGSALLVTEEAGGKHDVLVQPDDGSAARPYAATGADETSARFSPDGKWVAYTSDESGRPEVYLDAYPTPGKRTQLSTAGGADPVWRADGKELYYWRDDQLVAVRLDPGTDKTPPNADGERILFRAPYQHSVNTMYDASPDGSRFVIVLHQ